VDLYVAATADSPHMLIVIPVRVPPREIVMGFGGPSPAAAMGMPIQKQPVPLLA
jgi:hypothetical protein